MRHAFPTALAVLLSAPSILSVAVTVSFSGDHCSRARVALTGLETAPARVLEAESRVEGTPGGERDLERCAEQVAARAPFREDAHATATLDVTYGILVLSNQKTARQAGRTIPIQIELLNAAGQVLTWVQMFDDDQSVLDFLDHSRKRFQDKADAKQLVVTERHHQRRESLFPGDTQS